MRGHATPRPGQGSPAFVIAASLAKRPDGNDASPNLADQRRNSRPRPRCRGLPRQTEHAHGGRLVVENARDGLDQALGGARSEEPARSISGNRPKSMQGRHRPRRLQGVEGKGSALQLGERSGSRAWGRASQPMCAGHSQKSFSSRALKIAATRPIASSYPSVMRGLSPSPVGQQRLHSTIFPFAPQKN